MKLKLIIEKSDETFWGRIEDAGFLTVTAGQSVEEVTANVKMLIADYIAHEGQTDKKWRKVDAEKIVFDVQYDLRAFFDEYDFLNVSTIAKLAGINQSLVRQYKSGIKHPSTAQAKKVENVVHELGRKMNGISLVGSSV